MSLLVGATAVGQCQLGWSSAGGLAGANGAVTAMLERDPDGGGPSPSVMVVGGTFTLAGTAQASRIATYDRANGTWGDFFGSGIDGDVNALARMPNGDLVAAGNITAAGGVPVANIAKWDGNSWSGFGPGLIGTVHSLTVAPNGDLYAGGAILGVRIDIDPQFDIFRRLDSREIPAALSQGFGAEKPLLVLPANADKLVLQAYRSLAMQWQKNQSAALEVITDDQLTALPTDRTVWIMGWQNKFSNALLATLAEQDVAYQHGKLQLDQQTYQQADHAIVLTARQPSNPDKTLLWIAADQPKAIAELANKLPHYRKYSYLAFKNGDELFLLRLELPDSSMAHCSE